MPKDEESVSAAVEIEEIAVAKEDVRGYSREETSVDNVRDFLLPDLGEGLESAEIVKWYVDVGDRVELNQVICDVETAKAVVSVPCPFAGTVVERFGEAAEELEVGSPLIRIDVEGDASGAAGQSESVMLVEEVRAESEADVYEGGEKVVAGGAEKRHSVLVGYGSATASSPRRRRGGEKRTDPKVPDGAPGRDRGERRADRKPLATPPVRKLAKDLGVDLEDIAPGTGEGGIITREDVRVAARGVAAGELDSAASGERGAEAVGLGFRGREPGDVIPVRGIRKRIMAKMVQSRTKIPEATTSLTVDCSRTWALAEALTDQARAEGRDIRITAFAVVLRATVSALRRFPTLNAVLDEDAGEIRLLEPVHLGVAVDTDRGLLVPVIGDAHLKTTLELSQDLNRLAQEARGGSIGPSDLTGGTFTVNNYGSLGNDWGDPIINYPEAAILGLGAMKERPWVVDGQVVARRTVTLTVAFDHRICDGGEAGGFLGFLGRLLEEPQRALLHL